MEEEIQKIAYEYQLLQAQAQLLAQNLELLTLGKNEFQAVRETLEALKKEEGTPEVLIPIGAGSFLKGRIEDTAHAIVSVGAGYATEKSIEDAVEYLSKRIREYDEAIVRTQNALEELEKRLQQLSQRAQEIQEKQALKFNVPRGS